MMRRITLKRDGDTYLFQWPIGREDDLAAEIHRQASDPGNALDELDGRCLIRLLHASVAGGIDQDRGDPLWVPPLLPERARTIDSGRARPR